MSSTASPILDQMRARAGQLFRSGKFDDAIAAYRGIMEVVPGDFDAIHHLGQAAIQLGHLEESRKLLKAAVSLKPEHAEAALHYGMALQHLGLADDAVASYERAMSLKPDYSEAVFCIAVTQKDAGRAKEALDGFNRFIGMRGDQPLAFLHRGDLLRGKGDFSNALADYESALTLRPEYVDGWIHRGALLSEQGRPAEALENYDRAKALAPQNGYVFYNRGVALQDLGRDDEALESYEQSVKLAPGFADAWNNRGILLRRAKRLEDALVSFDRALKLDPNHIQSLSNRGATLTELRRFAEALASYDRALAVAPDDAGGWYNRGVALHDLGRNKEALVAYDRAMALNPNMADAWNNRGAILRDLGKFEQAQGSFQRALEIDPRHAGTLANSGAGLQTLKRFVDAGREFRKLEMVAPEHKFLLAGLAVSALSLCEWQVLDSLKSRLEAEVLSGKSIVPPFTLLGISSNPALQRICAQHYLRDFLGPLALPPRPAPKSHGKIRLAYLSADFHAHATARLMADLFERHDRQRFEVIAISFSPDEKSDVQERLRQAFDQFHDVRAMSDSEVADLLRKLEVDIAVDLKGYTEGARLGILASRPAPVQVSYLGYPGTSAAEFLDYVIADPVALPMDQQEFYSEQIVHLPDSYQANDPRRGIGPVPARSQAGLPPEGFVFNCFNNHWKITAPVFAVWMRLLESVPGSVLWLLDDSANTNLRREAIARGIDPERLIFAPKLAHDAHLGRLGLADLVLDTLPYNAHTTASDALWTGVPLVTVMGEGFAGRVAASLLTAVGLPELIAGDLQAYETLALSLAKDYQKHNLVKARLVGNRPSAPLFDAPKFCGHIEAAFITMAERARRGEAPRPFAVPS
ncbi:MAG TPA: tetratricopeptide repeat protein [Rhizomicrobium sp.]|nr:tetratricopeptide repeat protein [Rhizomicrobium sp.]